MRGIIIKGIGGFYYVKTADRAYQCRARGIFKKEGLIPCVGDEVRFQLTDILDNEGVVDEILPRKNVFIRPPIANIDCFVVVMSLKNPEPNLFILDKFLVMAEKAEAEIIIVLNKKDLVSENEIDRIKDIYQPIYQVLQMSASNGEGIDLLKEHLIGKKSAFAGPSGVGKSSLINRLQPGLHTEVGKISSKSKRGKHTTRHVEIFETDFGGMLFDTPGFTSFDMIESEEGELSSYYPDFTEFEKQCRYRDCLHISEPDCGVRLALEEGTIHESRYQSYVLQLEELQDKLKYKW